MIEEQPRKGLGQPLTIDHRPLTIDGANNANPVKGECLFLVLAPRGNEDGAGACTTFFRAQSKPPHYEETTMYDNELKPVAKELRTPTDLTKEAVVGFPPPSADCSPTSSRSTSRPRISTGT